MGISFDNTEEQWVVDNREWLGSRMGMDQARTITVDINMFNVEHYVNGFIPSGTVLAKFTAGPSNGLYGPYDPAGTDGQDTAAGFLFTPVQVKIANITTVTKAGAPLYWGPGIIITSKLPTFTGGAATLGVLDAGAKADLANFIRFE